MSVASGSPVWTDERRKLILGPLIKSGGAGSVYHLPASPSQVAKIYHDSIDRLEYERKVGAMLELSPHLADLVENGQSYVQIAWPQLSLRDAQGRFVGFAMPMVDVRATSELECILQERQAREARLPNGLGVKVTLAANLAAVISELHRQGHHVIDLKPVNLRFYPQSLYMAMLDCDGFSIRGRGASFAAEQITPDYLAPEFHGTTIPRAAEEQQDRFALAVVIFQLLNFGIHPFTGRPSSDAVPTDIPGRIAARCYAYGTRANPSLTPSPVSGHAAMPFELRLLFDRAFESAGSTRPSADEWAAAMKPYAQRSSQRLAICSRNIAHQHFAGLPCAACARAALLVATAKNAQAAQSARARPNVPVPTPTPKPLRPMIGATGMRIPHLQHPVSPLQPTPRGTAKGWPVPATRPTAPVSFWRRMAGTMGMQWNGMRATDQVKLAVALVVVILLVVLRPILDGPTAQFYQGPPPPPIRATPPSASPSATTAAPSVTTVPSPAELSWATGNIQIVTRSLVSGETDAVIFAMSRLRGAAAAHPASASGATAAAVVGLPTDISEHPDAQRRALVVNLEDELKQHPYDGEAAFELGVLTLLAGDRNVAWNWFVQAIWTDPKQAKYWYGLGVASLDDDDAVGAMAVAESLTDNPTEAQQARDGFPPELFSAAGSDRQRIALLQERAQKISALYGAAIHPAR